MSRDYWWALVTLIIAVALAFILLSTAKDEPRGENLSDRHGVPPLQPSVYDKKLDRLDRRGIEAAYSSRVALLFQNWMTDTTDESHKRALRGHRNARTIYIEAMSGLDARDPNPLPDEP